MAIYNVGSRFAHARCRGNASGFIVGVRSGACFFNMMVGIPTMGASLSMARARRWPRDPSDLSAGTWVDEERQEKGRSTYRCKNCSWYYRHLPQGAALPHAETQKYIDGNVKTAKASNFSSHQLSKFHIAATESFTGEESDLLCGAPSALESDSVFDRVLLTNASPSAGGF